MQNDKFHRRYDGSIDVDAYRREAIALRVQTWTRFFKQLRRVAAPVTNAAISAAGALPRPHIPSGHAGAGEAYPFLRVKRTSLGTRSVMHQRTRFVKVTQYPRPVRSWSSWHS
jgi:hypothetical protein